MTVSSINVEPVKVTNTNDKGDINQTCHRVLTVNHDDREVLTKSLLILFWSSVLVNIPFTPPATSNQYVLVWV